MSGPATDAGAALDGRADEPPGRGVEIVDGREAQVGAFRVRRALPTRGRRSVGPWCFLDHMGPAPVTEDRGLDIGPHPHIGLRTVTWLFEGEALHRDSLGNEQLIRSGQLNLMTAGYGVAHSEEATGRYRGGLHGVQLWIAQPEASRNGAAGFEHHAELPQADVGAAVATVFAGRFAGVRSPAAGADDIAGVDLRLAAGVRSLPLDPGHEHALVVCSGGVGVAAAGTATGEDVGPGRLVYVGVGHDEVELATTAPARALLVGGAPFGEPLLMWWNFVARTRQEVNDAYRSWQRGDGRFGRVASPLPPVTVPRPPWPAT